MWPEPRYTAWWQGITWDTPEYWAKRDAREKLMRARSLAHQDRPRRKNVRKRSEASRRRNRRAS